VTLRLGSARDSRAGFGDSPKHSSVKRPYNNQLDTACRALDAIHSCPKGLRALARLQTKWPEENWPEFLAAVFCNVLFEPPPCGLPPIGGGR
jgi:hypothetical protein